MLYNRKMVALPVWKGNMIYLFNFGFYTEIGVQTNYYYRFYTSRNKVNESYNFISRVYIFRTNNSFKDWSIFCFYQFKWIQSIVYHFWKDAANNNRMRINNRNVTNQRVEF